MSAPETAPARTGDRAADLLLETVAAYPGIAARVETLRLGGEAQFAPAASGALPLLAAILCRRSGAGRVWIVCPTVRDQECLHDDLSIWIPDALLFPEITPAAGSAGDPDVVAERLATLHALAAPPGGEARAVVVHRPSLDDSVPDAAALARGMRRVARGDTLAPAALADTLAAAGYERVPRVALRGQFAVRGGILDLFSRHGGLPARIEFFGDEVESVRHFDPDTQTSVQQVEYCDLFLGDPAAGAVRLRDLISPADLVVDAGGDGALDLARAAIGAAAPTGEGGAEDHSCAFYEHGLGGFDPGEIVLDEARRAFFLRQLDEWRRERWALFAFCNNEGELERLRELLPPDILAYPLLHLGLAPLAAGFAFPAARVVVLTDAELFGRRRPPGTRWAAARARASARREPIDFGELADGDLVVHLEHGIARFEGLTAMPASGDGPAQEALALEFAGGARLYVPVEHSHLVSRYVGIGKRNPPLSSLGDNRWSRAKASAARAIEDYAAKLLAVQSERETLDGFAFPADGKWQREFEESFVHRETPDQLAAIADAKRDMESPKPMDRLVCGDVGFGKTEVAIRAAFKAVMGGKQVALLAPTTVLAQQHHETFRERMSDYPVTVEVLSRFRSASAQRAVLARLADGSVDIVIGTHRLLSGDVRFKDLGLVIVDEEQRFGVKQKERFKELFARVDVLTLSATPIPRTLYLSLMGARDMSTLETPPANRIPIETVVCGYDERIIRDAIRRELARQGQVYFLHNRIQSIGRIHERLRTLVPEARVDIGHGQMPEETLESVMHRFVRGETDVLLSTSIIESGLDIPNANTIIIDRADRFGLADLYQLRGRVGRAQHKAYAYLLLPRDLAAGAARKRVDTIKQYSALGAGFKIAMRDLEIRGAGNILGTAQSGHATAIGFDLYCQLLKQSVARLKGEKVPHRTDVYLSLDFLATRESDAGPGRAPAYIPASYMAEPETRIRAHRDLAASFSEQDLDALEATWADRFGAPPDAVRNLLAMAAVRMVAADRRVTRVEVKEDKLMLTRGGDYVLVGGRFPRLAATGARERLREIRALIATF